MTREEIRKILEPFANDGTLFAYHELLKKAFHKESFKLLLKLYRSDTSYIRDIKEQIEDANKSFEKLKIKKGFRITKGLMEDIIEFIVFDFNPEFEATIDDRPKKYKDYLFDNILVEDTDLKSDYSILYSFVAKIDHTTSLKMYYKEMERNKKYDGIEKICSDVTAILVLILLDYSISKYDGKYETDREFLFSLLLALRYYTMLVSLYSFEVKGEEISEELYFKSDKDKEYIEFQKEYIEKTRKELSTFEFNDPNVMKELLKYVETELVNRKYTLKNKKC